MSTRVRSHENLGFFMVAIRLIMHDGQIQPDLTEGVNVKDMTVTNGVLNRTLLRR